MYIIINRINDNAVSNAVCYLWDRQYLYMIRFFFFFYRKIAYHFVIIVITTSTDIEFDFLLSPHCLPHNHTWGEKLRQMENRVQFWIVYELHNWLQLPWALGQGMMFGWRYVHHTQILTLSLTHTGTQTHLFFCVCGITHWHNSFPSPLPLTLTITTKCLTLNPILTWTPKPQKSSP